MTQQTFSENEINQLRPVASLINQQTILKYVADKSGDLNVACGKDGDARPILNEINHIFDSFETIDITTFDTKFDLGISKDFQNNRNFINAMAYKMLKIAETYGRKSVFINLSYRLTLGDKSDDGKYDVTIEDASFQVDDIALANYLYNHLYKNKLLISESESETNTPFYEYYSREQRWKRHIGKSKIYNEIKRNANTLVRALGYDTRSKQYNQQRIVDEIITKLEYVTDNDMDMLEEFSQNFPQWVQFKDLIYNLETHQVAKAQPFFKLKHYHNYRIPTGLTDEELDNLPINNELTQIMYYESLSKDTLREQSALSKSIKDLFVDCKITKDEARREADIIVRRMKENFDEQDVEFLLSIFGNLFFHSNDWAVTLFIRGEAGIGKSQIFNFMADELIQSNSASLKQKQFDSDSRFTETGIYGKEFNLIGELKGKTLSTPMIEVIKSTLSDATPMEQKGGNFKDVKFYSKIIALGNRGQLPSIPTDDASDAGLRRRLVLIDCLPTPKNDLRTMYPMYQLSEKKSYFALLSMMTLTEHFNNGDIATFQKYGGCTLRVINGFTTKGMVKTTQSYFQSHDRYRKFFCELLNLYREQSYSAIANDGDMFRQWLYNLSAKQVKQYFIEWYGSEYPRTNITKEKLENHLKNAHDIEMKSYKTKTIEPSAKSKTVRGYGQKFVELVESVIIEDDPESLLLGFEAEN